MTVYHKDKTKPNRIKECRIAKGLSQPKLASLIGLTPCKAAIYCYESNKRLPNPPTLIKLSKALDVSIDYLLFIDDYPNHLSYIYNVLGFDDVLLSLFIENTCKLQNINRVNKYICSHYKGITNEA